MSRYEFRQTGGCFWPARDYTYGASLRIPVGTLFKIALEGESSYRFATGCCENGRFVIEDPPLGDFESANQAVAAARPQVESSNAFLHIHFKVGSNWLSAQFVRIDPEISIDDNRDDIEKEAIRLGLDLVKKKIAKEGRKLSDFSEEQIQEMAEEEVHNDARILPAAERIVSIRKQAGLELE